MNTATETKPTAKQKHMAAIATALGIPVDERRIGRHLAGLGIVEVCGRCGGSGRHSFCQQYGDKCFGCLGSGKRAAKLSAKVVAAVRIAIADGSVATMRARWAKRAVTKAAVMPICEAAQAMWRDCGLASDYHNATGYGWLGDDRDANASPLWFANSLMGAVYGAAYALASAVKDGRRIDVERAKREADELLALAERIAACPDWRGMGRKGCARREW